MDPASSENLGAYRQVSSAELHQDDKGRKKSNQKRANRDSQGYCFLTQACFCVGQYAMGFMCIISLNLYNDIKRDNLLSPFYSRQS